MSKAPEPLPAAFIDCLFPCLAGHETARTRVPGGEANHPHQQWSPGIKELVYVRPSSGLCERLCNFLFGVLRNDQCAVQHH